MGKSPTASEYILVPQAPTWLNTCATGTHEGCVTRVYWTCHHFPSKNHRVTPFPTWFLTMSKFKRPWATLLFHRNSPVWYFINQQVWAQINYIIPIVWSREGKPFVPDIYLNFRTGFVHTFALVGVLLKEHSEFRGPNNVKGISQLNVWTQELVVEQVHGKNLGKF